MQKSKNPSMASYFWVRLSWHTCFVTEIPLILVYFLATPHSGSSLATYGSVLATIVKYCSPLNPPRALLDTLRRDSQVLFELTADFVAKASQLQIASFYEMKMTRVGFMKKMVHTKHIPTERQ